MRGFIRGVSDATEAIYLLIHRLMDISIIRRDAEIQNFLEAKAQGNDIASCVVQEVLAHSYADPQDFFHDLFRYGCVSGMI